MVDSEQTVREFTESLLTDLSSGAITVHEALAACGQYAYLRQELGEASVVLSEASLLGDEELKDALTRVITGAAKKLSELPNFQSQQPDKPETEQGIRSRAELQQHASRRIRESTTASAAPIKERRRAFIHDLVMRYSRAVPAITDEQIGKAVNRSFVQAARADEASPDRFVDLLVNELAGEMGGQIQTDVREQTRAALRTQEGYVADIVAQNKRAVSIYRALYEEGTLGRPDVFVDVLLNASANESLEATKGRAEKLARVAEALDKSTERPGGRIQFFSAGGAKGVVGGLQKGADGILSLVGEPVRDMILHEKVNGTLRSLLSNTQRLSDRLGETFVRSSFFSHVTQDLTKQLGERPPGGHAGTIFDDVFSAVFRGPLAPSLARGTEANLFSFFELKRANAAAPKGRAFFRTNLLPWDVFRISDAYEAHGFAPSTSTSSASAVTRPGLLGLFPFVQTGSVGRLFGDLTSSFVDRLTSFAFINPKLPAQLSASRRAALVPTQLGEDMPYLVALVVVIVIVLLFLFPSPLNLNQLSHSSKVSALLAALESRYTTEYGSSVFLGPVGSIGPATSTCANIAGVHLYQNSPQWTSINCQSARPDVPACRPPTSCTIGASGCGSASATMILRSFGSSADVRAVWDTQHKNNGYQYYNGSCASYWGGVTAILQGAGLSVFSIGFSEIANVLKECGLVLAIVDEKWSSGDPTGHIIVITGISQEGGAVRVTTLDPLRPPGFVSTVTNTPTNNGDIRIRGLYGVVQ